MKQKSKRDYNSTVKKQSGAVTNKMYVIKKIFSIKYRRNICGIVETKHLYFNGNIPGKLVL